LICRLCAMMLCHSICFMFVAIAFYIFHFHAIYAVATYAAHAIFYLYAIITFIVALFILLMPLMTPF